MYYSFIITPIPYFVNNTFIVILLIISWYIHILYFVKKEISFVTASHKFLLNGS